MENWFWKASAWQYTRDCVVSNCKDLNILTLRNGSFSNFHFQIQQLLSIFFCKFMYTFFGELGYLAGCFGQQHFYGSARPEQNFFLILVCSEIEIEKSNGTDSNIYVISFPTSLKLISFVPFARKKLVQPKNTIYKSWYKVFVFIIHTCIEFV